MAVLPRLVYSGHTPNDDTRRRATILRASSPASGLGRISVAVISPDETAMREFPWRYCDAYALVVITGGHGRYRDVSGLETTIEPGHVITVLPGYGHWYGPRGDRWDELYVIFDGPLFDRLRADHVLDERRPVRRLEPLSGWLTRIVDTLRPPPHPTDPRVELLRFAALLAEIAAADQKAAGPQNAEDPVGQACQLLAANFADPVPLPEVARRVGLPYSTFRHRFARETGQSPSRYREARRIQAACDLLRDTSMTHRQIADALGYADEFHFSKRFRQAVGHSPRAYRNGNAQALRRDNAAVADHGQPLHAVSVIAHRHDPRIED
jgi:AraC-like DNA-binding protein